MANLQVKGIDDLLYEELRGHAQTENRSISQDLVFILKSFLSMKKEQQSPKSPAQVLLDLAGSWEDGKSADQLIRELRKSRRNSRKSFRGL